jgi:hypothetical protein
MIEFSPTEEFAKTMVSRKNAAMDG